MTAPEGRIIHISIHALLAESDGDTVTVGVGMLISIHALLAESDEDTTPNKLDKQHFYPRSPCGERQGKGHSRPCPPGFLSTLSLRRATAKCERRQHSIPISIHALLAESDTDCDGTGHIWAEFLSTLSLRRATAKVHKTVGHFCAYETNFMEIASSC